MRCYCVMHHGQPLEAVDRPVPQPQGTEVLVKVHAAGLCHTDLHLWEGHYDLGGGKKLALADRGIKPPLTLSHEIVGQVAAAGAEAEGMVGALAGRPVLIHPWIGCGECAACKRGEENICIKPQSLGVARPGGFAEFDELRELVALVKRIGMKAIPVARRPLSEANAALQDLQAGRVVGRAILVP
ncbi:MAG: alcohol dehydrogenase catalytic domain-containing protein [Betaproteobacteria bacterium]